MGNLSKNNETDASKVASAVAKVASQTETLAKMTANDPGRRDAMRLLNHMQEGASSSKLNQALGDYSKSKDR